MEPTEIHARATIAAALITSRAVELPTIPTGGDWWQDAAARRLRDLTEYVYQMITTPPQSLASLSGEAAAVGKNGGTDVGTEWRQGSVPEKP
jgi:hypothetical protein